jgi:acyl-CoA dehydrogenase family protein 9
VSKPDLASNLKNISEKDRKQIEKAQEMLGPDPERMGFIKNIFWGNFREELVFPYPEVGPEETARCDQLVAELDEYFRKEHPSIQIDQEQEIPQWAVKRLFEIGLLGMIVPKEYKGGGFGITSYNRALERVGSSCGSTAVLASAHLSIGCGAITLFGNEEQKKKYLPRVSNDTMSAFCLSEPNVGCDAGGQETTAVLTEDGKHFIVNGEKKWATSAAFAGVFTVVAKQRITDPKSGKEKDGITCLIVTPDMPGVDIYSRNRAKCCIRGTWQGRIRLKDVKVPRENVVHKEGKGLNVALTCLNIGRCTLAAGMVGAAKSAMKQATKWAKYRYQFDRPIFEFEQVQEKVATMAAYVYAAEAMLYMTTGMVDRNDDDIMLETAICKVFCSEMGFKAVDHALQIMGGEGTMAENEVERLWRDSRINRIVEGANEVMHSFIFAYGSKQLGEYLLEVRSKPMKHFGTALGVGAELFLGLRRPAPVITRLRPELSPLKEKIERNVCEYSHQVKMMLKIHKEKMVTRQMLQYRLSMCVTWIHAMVCCVARLDQSIRSGSNGEALADEKKTVEYFCDLADHEIATLIRGLYRNPDQTMLAAAQAAMNRNDQLPNSDYYIPEKTPDLEVRGTGKAVDTENIKQFGSGSMLEAADIPS